MTQLLFLCPAQQTDGGPLQSANTSSDKERPWLLQSCPIAAKKQVGNPPHIYNVWHSQYT